MRLAPLACIAVIGFPITSVSSRATQSVRNITKGDPCDKAMSQMEMNECYYHEYQKSDAHLNTIYKKLLARMQQELAVARKEDDSKEIEFCNQQIKKLKAAERAWINYRDLHCAAARHQDEPGTISPTIWAVCMTAVTNHRIEELKDVYEYGDKKLE